MEDKTFQSQFDSSIANYAKGNQYGVSLIPYHTHNGSDSPLIAQGPKFFTNIDRSTVSIDLSAGDIQNLTLGGNRTLVMTGAQAGDRFILRLIQDGTGNRTVTWFSTIHWPGGVAPTLTTTANHWDDFGFICTGLNQYDGLIVGQDIS